MQKLIFITFILLALICPSFSQDCGSFDYIPFVRTGSLGQFDPNQCVDDIVTDWAPISSTWDEDTGNANSLDYSAGTNTGQQVCYSGGTNSWHTTFNNATPLSSNQSGCMTFTIPEDDSDGHFVVGLWNPNGTTWGTAACQVYVEGNTLINSWRVISVLSGPGTAISTGWQTANWTFPMTFDVCFDHTAQEFYVNFDADNNGSREEIARGDACFCTVPVVCGSNLFHQTIKRVGVPTICDVLAANPSDPIGTADCDRGGQSNLDECNAGQNPEDPSDDTVAAPIARIASSALSTNGTAGLNVQLIGCDGNAPQCGEEITYKIFDDSGIELEVVTCQYGTASSCVSNVTGGYLGLQATASSYDTWLNHITGDPAGTCVNGTFSFTLDKESWAATNGFVYNGYDYGTDATAGPSAALGCDIAASQATDIHWDIFVGGGTDDVCVISNNADNASTTCSMLFQYSGSVRLQSNQWTYHRLISNHSNNLNIQADHMVIPDPTTLSSVTVDPTFYNAGAFTTLQHTAAWYTTNQAVTINSTGYTTVEGSLIESNGMTGDFTVDIENVAQGGGFVEFGANHTIRTSGDCDGVVVSFQINNNFGAADDNLTFDNAEWRIVQGGTIIDSGSIAPPSGTGASTDIYATRALAEGCFELLLDIDYTSHDGVTVEGNSRQDLLIVKQF